MKMQQRRRNPKRVLHKFECKKVGVSVQERHRTDSPHIICIPDLTELDLPPTMKTNFPDPSDLLNFYLTITPDEGEFPITSSINNPSTTDSVL
jgi:hypothetical protein